VRSPREERGDWQYGIGSMGSVPDPKITPHLTLVTAVPCKLLMSGFWILIFHAVVQQHIQGVVGSVNSHLIASSQLSMLAGKKSENWSILWQSTKVCDVLVFDHPVYISYVWQYLWVNVNNVSFSGELQFLFGHCSTLSHVLKSCQTFELCCAIVSRDVSCSGFKGQLSLWRLTDSV